MHCSFINDLGQSLQYFAISLQFFVLQYYGYVFRVTYLLFIYVSSMIFFKHYQNAWVKL